MALIPNQFEGLRVAFLHPRLEGGGAETVSLTTAKLFSQWGIRSTFIGYQHNPKEFILDECIDGEVHILPENTGFENETNKQALIEKLKGDNIKIAFVCYLNGDFFTEELQEASQCKFVYWNHSSPFWEHHYSVELGRNQARFSIRKWVEWNILGGKNRTIHGDGLMQLKMQYKRDIATFDRYLVLCEKYKKELVDTLSLSSQEQDKIVPMINTLEIEQKPNLDKDKVVAFIARLSIVPKQFDLMLKIWRRIENSLPGWQLKFYGSGPDEWLLHKLIQKYKLKRVSLEGYVSDMSCVYNEASIVCLTSSFEGWGMALTEAQNYGCIPMVFDNYGAARSVIGEEGAREGLLIPPFDLQRYADSLVEICTNDEKRARLQQISLKKRLDYAPNINDESWHKLFSDLLQA